MSKELEALERLAMPDDLHISECKKLGIGLTEDFSTIKQALQRLEKYEQLYVSKPSGEVISRAALCEAIRRIFGSGEKFLDIIEEDLPYGYHYCKDDSAEIYIIDYTHHKYIHWYKLTHIGRDFHTDMKTKEEVIDFLQRLHHKWLKENE